MHRRPNRPLEETYILGFRVRFPTPLWTYFFSIAHQHVGDVPRERATFQQDVYDVFRESTHLLQTLPDGAGVNRLLINRSIATPVSIVVSNRSLAPLHEPHRWGSHPRHGVRDCRHRAHGWTRASATAGRDKNLKTVSPSSPVNGERLDFYAEHRNSRGP